MSQNPVVPFPSFQQAPLSQPPSQVPPNVSSSPPSLPQQVNQVPPTGAPAFDNTLVHGEKNLSAGSKNPEQLAQTSLNPGQFTSGATNIEVVSPEDSLSRADDIDPNRDFDAEIAELQRLKAKRDAASGTGFTALTDHPPLKPGDRIQGPHDRENRAPTDEELAHGKMQLMNQKLAATGEHVPHDPPIEKNAPRDVPADPRKVAEGRGLKFDEKRPTGTPVVE